MTEKEPNAQLPLIPAMSHETTVSKNSAVDQVPLGRYFVFVGSLILAMLFVTDRYSSDSRSQAFQREAHDVDRSILRISSVHRWPERIVFDTNLATIVPPQQEPLAETPPVRPLTEAFAQVVAPSPKTPKHPSEVKLKRKLMKRVINTRVATYRPTVTLPARW